MNRKIRRGLRGVITVRADGTDLAGLIAKLNKEWEDFKVKDSEARKKPDPLVVQEVEKINNEITNILASIKKIEAEASRPKPGLMGSAADITKNVRWFNRTLASNAIRLNRPKPAEVDAAGYENYTKAFDQFMRSNVLSGDILNALMVGSDPDGGYVCPPEIDYAIDRVVTQLGAMRGLATVRTIGSVSYKKYMTTTGAGFGGWGTEGTQPTETTTQKLAELEFVPGLMWAEPRATSQQLEDSVIDAEAWLADEVGLTFAEQEASAFISGSGINRPRGINQYPFVLNSSYAWGSVGYTKTGAAASFAASNPSDNIMDLIHSLRRQYRQGAQFVMTDLTLATIRKFKDGQGIYLWAPSGLQGGQVGVLLGYPVNTDDFMDDLGANKFPIAFADFRRAYVIVDRRGTTVLRDNLTAKPWVKFYTTRRVGGGIQNYEAIKFLKCEA